MRVLIVEDDLLIGMLIEDMLVNLGHEAVGPVDCVAEAMPLIAKCDFAILDVHVADGESYPVADALKKHNVPFCFSSGSGCADYIDALTLRKPFKQPELQVVLDAHRSKYGC